MTPIVATVFTLTVAALGWLCVAIIVAYRRRVRREEPRFVTVLSKGREQIDTRGGA